MTRPDYYDSVAGEPPTTGPKGAAGDSGARSLADEVRAKVDKVRAEAGTFAPRRIGPMAESAQDIQVIVTRRPGGIHRVLCRFGLHAWMERFEGTRYSAQRVVHRCAVCGVPRG